MSARRGTAQSADEDRGAGSGGEAATLAETAYRRLRRDIIAGVFAPGQPLRLELLRQRYGLSFSPLREALNRLQTERLVAAAALRGFSVAPLSSAEMWDATNTRILIDCEALRLSVRNGDDDWEAGVVAAYHALDLQARRVRPRAGEAGDEDLEALETRHQDFHRALIRNCGSRRLIDLSDQLHAETQRYRLPMLTGRMFREEARDVPSEHRQIMDTALARKADEAAALLAGHYRRTAELLDAELSAAR